MISCGRRVDSKGLDEECRRRCVNGGQELIIVIGRDVTQRLRLEQQLRQSQKMDAIGQLTGGVAHDFNNLLTVITGTIEILTAGLSGQPELATISHMIDEAATRGADLTRQLLAFARKQPLQPRDTDINTLIVDTAKLLRPTLGEQVEIDSALQTDCWRALIDPSQLSTLINLAVNARDAMTGGGKITFGTTNVSFAVGFDAIGGDLVIYHITVNDTGAGIQRSATRYSSRSSPPRSLAGTGLGLSMVTASSSNPAATSRSTAWRGVGRQSACICRAASRRRHFRTRAR